MIDGLILSEEIAYLELNHLDELMGLPASDPMEVIAMNRASVVSFSKENQQSGPMPRLGGRRSGQGSRMRLKREHRGGWGDSISSPHYCRVRQYEIPLNHNERRMNHSSAYLRFFNPPVCFLSDMW